MNCLKCNCEINFNTRKDLWFKNQGRSNPKYCTNCQLTIKRNKNNLRKQLNATK